MLILLLVSCSSTDSVSEITGPSNADLKILSLGDSYTIGESVCNLCRFPEQLKSKLSQNLSKTIALEIIATTGWTTTDLKQSISRQDKTTDYDLVTLLIGVNNQFQGKSFSLYEDEFPELLTEALEFAGGDHRKVIVLSIPDYAFTPFGQSRSNPEQISDELDRYNDYAKSQAQERDILFINITDITKNGLENPELVASDGLHPSEEAYRLFVERLLPSAQSKIQL